MADHLAPTSSADLPDTDDPVVLRERLQQAREHLRLHESIEQMMAERLARTEALLIEARTGQHESDGPDPATVRSVLRETRDALDRALRRLDALDTSAASPEPETSTTPAAQIPSTVEEPTPSQPRTVDVLVHNITSPAQARSLQQHLAAHDAVESAMVRELAEGMLRITVETQSPLTSQDLTSWQSDRSRTVRIERADVLEIALED